MTIVRFHLKCHIDLESYKPGLLRIRKSIKMKLLVPTDFSKNAQKAIDYAVSIADKTNAEIVLLHAYQIIDTTSQSRKLLFQEYNYSTAKKLHDELKLQTNRIGKINPSIRVTAVLSDNVTTRSIINEGITADLIVMGTQGATGLKRIFMGSVTASVIGNATVPVLAIPRHYKPEQPKNILLATNRFEQSPEILDPLFKLAKIFDSTLHVIVFSDTDRTHEAELQQQASALEHYQNELGNLAKGLKVTPVHLKGSDFEETLEQYIDEASIDMLAMVTYKKNLLENIFHRSASKRMAYRTRIPLLAIPTVS